MPKNGELLSSKSFSKLSFGHGTASSTSHSPRRSDPDSSPRPFLDKFESQDEVRMQSRRDSLIRVDSKRYLEIELNHSTQITPQSDKQFRLLKACVEMEGGGRLSEGKSPTFATGTIKVKLLLAFWDWLSEQNTNIAKQAFLDAVYISGVKSLMPADCLRFGKEIGLDKKWSDSDRSQLRAITRNALTQLEEYRVHRKGVHKLDSEEDLIKEYKAATDGGDLKADYKHYRRARKFSKQLKKVAEQRAGQRGGELHKLLSSDQSTCIATLALKRLQMKFESFQ